MRLAGTLDQESEAQKIEGYLLAQGIPCQLRDSADGFGIWVLESGELERARRELEIFRQEMDNPRYDHAVTAGRAVRSEEKKEQRKRAARVVHVTNRWSPPQPHEIPIVMGLSIVCILVAVLTRLGDNLEHPIGQLLLVFPDRELSTIAKLVPTPFGDEPAPSAVERVWLLLSGDFVRGQFWRLFTPAFLHFNLFHLLFNLGWLYVLGATLESRRGKLRFASLVLVTGVGSNVAQFALGSSLWFGGMSGVVYGLIGYAWMKTVYEPRLGIHLSRQALNLSLFWFVLCWLLPALNVANWAHGGGLLLGILIGRIPVRERSGFS